VFNYLGRGLGRALSLAAIGVALVLTRRWPAPLAFAAAEALTGSPRTCSSTLPIGFVLERHACVRRPAEA
jgi:hypothetical protein